MGINPAGKAGDQPNHPLAGRMALIAGLSNNIIIGSLMGSFGIFLASVQLHLDVELEQASVGMMVMLVGASALAPIIGVMIARYSLRALLITGTVMMVLGFLILGFTTSYPIYLAVFGLLFGPALSLAGSMGPATLVTRWFNQNRGLALGLIHLPIIVGIMPIGLNAFLSIYSVQAAYLTLAAVGALVLLPVVMLTIDYPPGYAAPIVAGEQRTVDGSLSVGQLVSKPKFWALALAYICSTTSSVTLGSLLIPMAETWDFTRSQAALLASIMAMVGLAGSILFGWVADKLGGGRTLALIGCNCALLWSLLLLESSFFVVAIIIGLIGLHGVGAVPAFGRGLSDAYGQASYSRGVGLSSVISLPFKAIAMIGASRIATETGSFAIPVTVMACVFVGAVACGLYAASGAKAVGKEGELQLA